MATTDFTSKGWFERRISLKYPNRCNYCKKVLEVGTVAWGIKNEGEKWIFVCEACHEAHPEGPKSVLDATIEISDPAIAEKLKKMVNVIDEKLITEEGLYLEEAVKQVQEKAPVEPEKSEFERICENAQWSLKKD